MAVTVKSFILWDMTRYVAVEVHRRFESAYFLRLEGIKMTLCSLLGMFSTF
jgi:hypothetical protein